MNNDIQPGDTVEFLEDDLGQHPTLSGTFLRKGDRVVVGQVKNNYVVYGTYDNFWIHKSCVKKVIPNQVEVKFR
jgi:hypothetical protein